MFRSAEEVACDEFAASFAAAMGDLDPFACPAGSTNTIFEHVFYTGTTNAPFAYPSDTADTAVLVVTVSGVGSGELRIGDRVVPLLARPRPRLLMGANGAPDPTATTLRVPVAKDKTHRLYLRGDATLSLSLDSDDFAFGVLPDLSGRHCRGWINFPNAEASHPCIHSFMEHETEVTLPVGEGADELTCTWNETDDVEVWNRPPRSARISGRFDPRQERPVTYTLSHPLYLFGRTEYEQNVRYCPKPSDDDPTDYYDEEVLYPDECWCCHWQTCDTNCTCGCSLCGDWTDTLTNDCEFASTNYPHLQGVLKIRTPREYSTSVALSVPTGVRNCCPCPEHHTNGVSLVYARRVSVVDPSDSAFRSSDKPVTVRVAATEPSYDPGDGRALFATNGVPLESNDYTCLGVGVSAYGVDFAALNAKNRQFGLPIVVNTNLDEAVLIRLDVNVLLRGGRIRLSVEDATAPLEVWGPGSIRGEWAKFADADTSLDVTMAEWRRMTGHADDGGVPSVNVRLLVPHAGKATIVLHYWNVIGGKFVEDEARQVVTAVNPPLLPDYNRDGAINAQDVTNWLGGAIFRYWTNEDCDKGDYVGQRSDIRPNIERSAELANVKGRLDLVNLFPVQLDLASVVGAFGDAVIVKLRGRSSNIRYCLAAVQSDDVGSIYRSDVRTTDDELISEARLSDLGRTWVPLSDLGAAAQSIFAFEAIGNVDSETSPEVAVFLDGQEILRHRLKCSIRSVKDMYRWLNIRSACSDGRGESNRLSSPSGNPDSECDERHFVFVHGYSVSSAAARVWADQIFKRLWLSGSHSRFTAVDWSGDYSQFANYALNYWANVVNALHSAPELAARVNALPGRKVILAHSLGNMLTSEACKCHNLSYDKYYMLNAAVPVEAYDASAQEQENMIPTVWKQYPDDLRSANWHTFFDVSDGRSKLTWRGRYSGLTNSINCYSPTEDVLANSPEVGPGEAWSAQELLKGSLVMSLMPHVAREAGWGFNPLHTIPMSQDELLKTSYTDDEMKLSPPFLPFADDWLHVTNALSVAQVEAVLPRILADGIPATTYAAGANQVDGVSDNISYQAYMTNLSVWPDGKRKEGRLVWEHSDIKNLAYLYVYQFYERIVGGH